MFIYIGDEKPLLPPCYGQPYYHNISRNKELKYLNFRYCLTFLTRYSEIVTSIDERQILKFHLFLMEHRQTVHDVASYQDFRCLITVYSIIIYRN